MKDSTPSTSQVQQSIHYDHLWQQALSDIGTYAKDSWSDTADHDPGVTLLQGMSYAVSDLSYRHTLPLTDLLTPAQQTGDGLFPASFGPDQTLTGSPVTADDYRRAILDLRSSNDSNGQFYFRDVQLVLADDISQESHGYWYDPDSREFNFQRTDSQSASSQLFVLKGMYKLLVELNRGVSQADAEPVLRAFLTHNRNVCEWFGPITWVQPQEVDVQLLIELEDDFVDADQLLANIYMTLESYLSPQAQRFSAAQLSAQGLSNEQIYQGPKLQHGWITELPTPRDYSSGFTLNINPLVPALLAMKGVKYLETLAMTPGGWSCNFPAGTCARLWGDDPLQILADGVQVKLMKRGQQLKASKAAIQQALPPTVLINESPVLMPYGRFRNPSRYYPVSDTIPPCYGLQQSPAGAAAQELYQFLLAFEQLLANGCDQLANLPQLLAFDRSATQGAQVFGGQWPFVDGALANAVHAGYSDALKQWVNQQRQDYDKELSIIEYLLGYFGDNRSSRTLLSVSEDDFLTIQRGYLQQHSALGYARNQFTKTDISALQRRIAARMGVSKELFVNNAQIDAKSLPFYLMENISLLPPEPDSRYDALQPTNAAVPDDPDAPSSLSLTLAVTGLQPGLLIDLTILNEDSNKEPYTITGCMVTQVTGNTVYLDLTENVQLRSNWKLVVDAQSIGMLRWSNSSLWLKDMTYSLTYDTSQAADESGLWIAAEPLPRNLQVNDTIAIYLESTTDNHEGVVTYAKVTRVNAIASVFQIQWQSGPPLPAPDQQMKYYWHVESSQITDRFSFGVSVIFNRDLLANTNDPYMIDAWVKNIIQDELPCHVTASVLWLSEDAFNDFSWAYTRWQTTKHGQLGLLSYSLMKSLALGLPPGGAQGINAMRIATDAQQVSATQPVWNYDYIKDYMLFYMPPL
ncbi:hypothetical protein KBJ94_29220 [Pseudomonas sp. ITA]|uniref:hypothetical protein n=1 Tax=Pseudomonas sp. ITA TaxID=2825841 RepID=UPI0024987097|nr:hypothetical protein [Pseudomonas sp. ITA]MDI2146131.1 hypothetical protein [Pseudomonas sp. ITA]